MKCEDCGNELTDAGPGIGLYCATRDCPGRPGRVMGALNRMVDDVLKPPMKSCSWERGNEILRYHCEASSRSGTYPDYKGLINWEFCPYCGQRIQWKQR